MIFENYMQRTQREQREHELSRETQLREKFEEEVWCAHRWLDERGIPRTDVGGEVFSLVGRMMQLAKINPS